MIKKILLVLIFLFMVSCSVKTPSKSDLPSWKMTMNFPMGEKTFFMDDLFDDSTFVKYVTDDGDSIYTFEDTSIEMDRTEIGDSLKISDISENFSQSVDQVEIADVSKNFTMEMDVVEIDPFNKDFSNSIGLISLEDNATISSAPIALEEIIDFSLLNEGDELTIQRATVVPTIYRSIEFDQFNEANIESGFIDMEIFNNLVIELGNPVTITLLNTDSVAIEDESGEVLRKIFNDPIESGANSGIQSLELNNVLLPRDIIVQVDGVLCGTAESQVTNNANTRNSSFYVTVETREIIVNSASAIIPAQVFDTTSVVDLPDSEHEIQSAVIDKGNLSINITNQLNVECSVALSIPSLSESGSAFQESFPIDPQATKDVVYSIDNYTITPNNNSVEIQVEMTTVNTDPNHVEISKNDGMDISAVFYGEEANSPIEFKEFTGKVDQEPIVESGEIDIESDTKINSGKISNGFLNINIQNNVINSIDQNLLLTLEIKDLIDSENQPLNVGPVEVIPGENQININDNSNSLQNYTIIPVEKDNDAQVIIYEASIEIPENATGNYDLENSFITDISLSNLEFSEVTGYFDQEPIVTTDSVSLSDEHTIHEAYFETGTLMLTTINNLGLNANVDLVVEELINKETSEPLNIIQQIQTGEKVHYEEVDLSAYKIMSNSDSEYLHYESKVTIPSSEAMTLSLDQNIETSLSISNIIFEKIEGTLDTIEVNFDEQDEEFDDFPEELEEINLEEVEITINFDTNIDMDILLFLDITSFNSDGDHENIKVNHLIDPDDESTKILRITDASTLINIAPNRFLISGNAKLFGTGLVTSDQYIDGEVKISAPLILTVEEGAEINLDIEKMTEDIPDELESVHINTSIVNTLGIGGELVSLVAKDSNYFHDTSTIPPDTLVRLRFEKTEEFDSQIDIEDYLIDALRDSCFIKNIIQLDATEEGETIKIMSSDSLKFFMYGTVNGLIDLKDEEK